MNLKAKPVLTSADTLERLGHMVVIARSDGIIVSRNTPARSVLPDHSEHVYDVCGCPDPKTLARWLAEGGGTSTFEVMLGASQRHLLWTTHLDVPLDRLLLTGVDITEQTHHQRHHALVERVTSISTLATGMAHEMNNPLTYIVSNAEMLAEELEAQNASAELRDMANDCVHGAQRLVSILNDLQALAGNIRSSNPAPADLFSTVGNVVRVAQHHIQPRASLRIDVATGLKAPMSEAELGMLLLNLLINAAQAITPGQHAHNTITLRAATEPDVPGQLIITVTDTGQGIDPADQSRIFDPFFSHTHGGIGLGLSTCLLIVTRAGGRIEVESAVGQGSSFRIVLPSVRLP